MMYTKYDLIEYVDKLYSLAVKKTGDTHVAEDITQETFLAAVQSLSSGKQPDHIWAWLVRILSNKYCDWLREKYNKPYISFEEYPLDIAAESPMDDDSLDALEAIRRELGYLSRTHREVMIRFYLHNETIDRIAEDLNLPAGTVKSRLNTGRQQIRKGVNKMENYMQQSYEPDTLNLSCSGSSGLKEEPFSLVEYSDKLAQNILILAYPKPVTETELAKALGVPAAYVEPIVQKMVDGELMRRMDGGKIYTDFIIFTIQEREANIHKQLETADRHFSLFWKETEKALSALREKEYYKRQSPRARQKLELYFCILLLSNSCIKIRDEVTGYMPYSDYPYRKDGGRWLAMGFRYPADYDSSEHEDMWKYGINGEAGISVNNFHGAKYIELREYSTMLGRFPYEYLNAEYVKWIYELLTNVPPESSSVRNDLLQSAEDLIGYGILAKNQQLELDIPILSLNEYHDIRQTQTSFQNTLCSAVHDVVYPLFSEGYIKLPAHLKSVPNWQRYMICGDSLPMAVIYKFIENKLLLVDVDYPTPAAVYIIDKQ